MRFWKTKKRLKALEEEIYHIKFRQTRIESKVKILEFISESDEWIMFAKNVVNPITHNFKYKGGIKEIENREAASKQGFRLIGYDEGIEVWGK